MTEDKTTETVANRENWQTNWEYVETGLCLSVITN